LRVVSSHFFRAKLGLEWRNTGTDVFRELAPECVPPVRIILCDLGKVVGKGGASVAVVKGEEAWRARIAEGVRLAPSFGISIRSCRPPVKKA